jgi:hypothetical protein
VQLAYGLQFCAANTLSAGGNFMEHIKKLLVGGAFFALLATTSWGCTYYDRDYRYGRYDRYDRSERDGWERERDRDRDWRRDRFARYDDRYDDRWYGWRYDRDDWRDRHSRIDRHYYE